MANLLADPNLWYGGAFGNSPPDDDAVRYLSSDVPGGYEAGYVVQGYNYGGIATSTTIQTFGGVTAGDTITGELFLLEDAPIESAHFVVLAFYDGGWNEIGSVFFPDKLAGERIPFDIVLPTAETVAVIVTESGTEYDFNSNYAIALVIGVEGGGSPGECFWTNLKNATQVCS